MSTATTPTTGARRGIALAALLAVTALGAAGCTSGASGDGTSASGAPAEALEITAYSGPESEFPEAYPEPEKQDGVDCTVGFLNPTTAQPGLAAMQESLKTTIEGFGCTFIGLNANVDPAQQVTQFDQLLAQDVDAIILNPVDAQALAPQLQKAQAAGIPVIGESLPSTAQEVNSDYLVTNVLEGYDQKAYYPMATLAAAIPGAAFGIVGFGVPIPQLQYQVEQMKGYGEEFGLEYQGEADAAGDTASQYADAASTLLTRFPDIQAIVCFNDTAAEAAVGVVRSSGREVAVLGVNGDPNAIELVDGGSLLSTVDARYTDKGIQLAYAAYNQITGQNLPLAATVSIPLIPYLGAE